MAPARSDSGAIAVATFNVHRWIGADGVCNPMRGFRVINALQADVIGLQEVRLLYDQREPGTTEHLLASTTGMRVISGPTMLRRDVSYGNVLLTRRPVLDVRHHDLSVNDREPRGVLDVDIEWEGAPLRVLVTHLGLNPAERTGQARRLLELLAPPADDRVVALLGDLNQWFPWLGPLRKLHGWFGYHPVFRTFPSWLPVFPLDRILVQPNSRLVHIRVHRSREARVASDHLPLIAFISGR